MWFKTKWSKEGLYSTTHRWRGKSVLSIMKLWRLCWAGNTVRMKQIRNAHVILIGNLLQSGHLARPGDGMATLRQELWEIVWVGWRRNSIQRLSKEKKDMGIHVFVTRFDDKSMMWLLRTLCILQTYPASFCEDGDGASCLNTVREGRARRASLEQKANHTCDLLSSNKH